MSASSKLPDCPAGAAPSLEGMIRVTLVDERGEGNSAYFRPDGLPALMAKIDRWKDVRGRTHRSLAADVKEWAKLRGHAFKHAAVDPQAALTLLLWLHFRHPKEPRVADKLHQLLTQANRACLTIIHVRATGLTAFALGVDYLDDLGELAVAVRLPPGTMFVGPAPDAPFGTA